MFLAKGIFIDLGGALKDINVTFLIVAGFWSDDSFFFLIFPLSLSSATLFEDQGRTFYGLKSTFYFFADP